MYTKFFGLSRRPFEDRADPQFYFPTPHADEALAALEYESRYGQSIALLIGEAGTGKTLLIRSLLMRARPEDHSVVLTWNAGGTASVIRETCKTFGVTLPSSFSTGRGLARIRRHLSRVGSDGRHAFLVIDQAEHLTQENLAEISALTSLHEGDHSVLTVILSGQPHIKVELDQPELSSLRQRLFGERVLSPFTMGETRAYIMHRLKVAGATNADMFDESAVALIHRISGGVPRLINRVAGEAMLSAYGASTRRVTEAMVAEFANSEPLADRDAVPQDRPISQGANEGVAAGAVDAADAANAADVADVAVKRGLSLSHNVAYEGLPPTGGGRTREDSAPVLEPTAMEPLAAYLPSTDPYVVDGLESLAPLDRTEKLAAMLHRGQSVVAKLERMLARAERMSSTSQASIMESTAVETHLETLVGRAERLAGVFSDSVQHADDKLSQLEARIQSRLSATEQQMQATEARLATVPEVLDRSEQGLTRLKDACAAAEEVEASLRQFGEQLADQGEAVQERIAIAVAGTKAGQEVYDRAAKLVEDVQRVEAAHERSKKIASERAAAQFTEMKSSSEQAAQQARDQMSSLCARLENSVAAQEQRIESLEGRVELKLGALGEALARADQAVATIRSEAEKSATESGRVQRRLLHEGVDQCERTLQEMVDRHAAVQEESMRVMESRKAQLGKDVESFGRRIGTWKESLDEAGRKIETTLEESLAVAERCDEMHAAALAKEREARQVMTDLDGSVKRGAAFKQEVQQTVGSAQQLQRSVAATLVDVGAAHERAASARAQLDGYGETVGGMVAQVEKSVELGRVAAQGLRDVLSDSDQLRTDLAKTSEEASARVLEFRSGVDRAQGEADATITRIVEAVDRHTKQFHGAVAGMAEEASAKAESIRSDVLQVQRKAEATVAELARAVTQGSDAISSVAAEATTKAAQLDSHNAAARGVLHELADMSKHGRDLLGHAQAVLEDMDDKTVKVQSTIESLWGLTGGAETKSKALAEAQRASESATVQLTKEVNAARQTLKELADQSTDAKAENQIIETRCHEARRIAKRLTTISELLKTAKETERSVTEMVDGARRVADELSSAASASDHLLGRFSDQGKGIAEAISALESRAAKLDSAIKHAGEEPAKLIRSAKVQAAQLERVCGAVKKVFSALSKTTIEAKAQTAACGEVSTIVVQRIRSLRAETDRSSKTLREWIAEAIRVQTRLERSLDKAPSIRETHPMADLTDLSDRMVVSGSIPESVADGELTMLGDPERIGGARPWPDAAASSELVGTHANRAEEISRLLEDAKTLGPK